MTSTARPALARLFCATLLGLSLTPGLVGQEQQVTIEALPVADGLYMLTGQGGNIGVSVGDDGVFMVDDQFAPLTEQILAAVGKLSDRPVRFLANTHWHGDHTGGNENLGRAGVLIVAHANVRERMSTEQFMEAFGRKVPPSPPEALPVVTFADSVTFHWNGDELHVFHVPHAHTDGDAIIHFKRSNAFHMGDTFFKGSYPFIDHSSGGSIHGVIAAAHAVLERADDDTKIIPGHGTLATPADLRAYVGMLETVRDGIQPMIDAGKSRDEVVAAKPTAKLDGDWGKGFMRPDMWVGIVYESMLGDDRDGEARGR